MPTEMRAGAFDGTLDEAITAVTAEARGRETWDAPLDSFSWGRDRRHKVDDTESLPEGPGGQRRPSLSKRLRRSLRALVGGGEDVWARAQRKIREDYGGFAETYALMSDKPSRRLFAELLLMKQVGEQAMRLSSFTSEFADTYERASDAVLAAEETLPVYDWVLRRIDLEDPRVSFYTVPTILNLHMTGRLYRYEHGGVTIGVEPGDVVLDAGVGWGDTTVYLASIASSGGGHLHAFDILDEGLAALEKQRALNPALEGLTANLGALSDVDGDTVTISDPGPGAKVTGDSGGRSVETMTLDTYVESKGIERVDLIKMDIEGAEIPALRGAARTIAAHKPKLAISAYHLWDDLLTIPSLIHGLRQDYSYHLDCTTGFGGETVLFCR